MTVPAEVRRNATLVLVAGGLYFVLQAVLTGFAVPLGPYERVVFPGVSTQDLWVLRLAVMVVSTAGFVLAFHAWVRPAGKASWAAAGFVAVSWAPVHFGPQARPEILLTWACVLTVGYTTRWLVERDRGSLAGIAGGTAVAMVGDPAIGTALALALTAVVLVWARVNGGLALIALGGGVLAGRLLGSLVRGVLAAGEALARATAEESEGLRPPLLRILDPGAAVDPGAFYRALAGALVVVTLVVLGVVWQRWPHRHNAARVGTAVAAALLVAVTLTSASAPFAMLPVLGVLAIAVGAGLLAAWRRARELGTPLATVAYVLVVVAYVAWQGAVAAGAA